MGTRHLICVFYKGKFVVAQYGQYDGYPEGQGVAIVRFLRKPANVQELKRGLKYTYTVSELSAEKAKMRIDALQGLKLLAWRYFVKYRDELLTVQIMDYLEPSLHPVTGAAILEVVAQARAWRKVPIRFELEFANDQFSCEYTYVIDLDKDVLEVFGHVGDDKTPGHRFAGVGEDDDPVPSYISSFEFSELQKSNGEQDFLDHLDRIENARSERDLDDFTDSSESAAEYAM